MSPSVQATSGATQRPVAVVDIGTGNVGSVINMVRRAGGEAVVATTPDEVERGGGVVLPGVGHWDSAVAMLRQTGVGEAIVTTAQRGTPVLGICLGMQLLLESSEEGRLDGLGLVPGRNVRFDLSQVPTGRHRLKVPHMGWNLVQPSRHDPLLAELDEQSRFYFVHSFHADGIDPGDALLRAWHGYEFVCGIRQGNVTGVQFHPEKSHRFGLQLMTNWLAA